MNPNNSRSRAFLVTAILGLLDGKTPEQMADDQLKRWHVERHGWVPLGRDSRDGQEKWTTLERGLTNMVTLDVAAALSGYEEPAR